MKKTLFICLLVGFIAGPAFAQGPMASGTPEVFEMTFTKLTMIKKDGTELVVNNTPSTVDLAKANAGQSLGEAMAGSVPPGVYTQLNSTVSMNITMKGAVKSGTDIYYTTAGTVVVPGNVNPAKTGDGCVAGIYDTTVPGAHQTVQDWLDADSPVQPGEDAYAKCSIRPPDTDATLTVSIDGEETVADGDVMEETMEADVTGVLQLWDFQAVPGVNEIIFFPGPPNIDIQ